MDNSGELSEAVQDIVDEISKSENPALEEGEAEVTLQISLKQSYDARFATSICTLQFQRIGDYH